MWLALVAVVTIGLAIGGLRREARIAMDLERHGQEWEGAVNLVRYLGVILFGLLLIALDIGT